MANRTEYALSGFDLRNLGWDLSSIAGWDGWPGMRVGESAYGYEHGARFDDRGFFLPRDVGLSMVVLPRDPTTGAQTLDPAVHAQANLDDVLGAFYALGGATLTRTMPDATVRELFGLRPVSAWPVEPGPGTFGRRVNVLLRAPYPFWQQTGVQTSGAQTGSFALTNSGNAPINNMVVLFTTAGRLTHTGSGDWIEVTENSITADVGAKTAKNGSTFKDNKFGRLNPWWLQMEPGVNNFAVSGGGNVTVTYYHHWL